MGNQPNEMVYVEIRWHEPGKIITQDHWNKMDEPLPLWFMVMADTICPISAKGAVVCVDYLRGEIRFKPMHAQHFPITPWVSYIDIELDMHGMDEAFGAGYDVEEIATYAYKHRDDEAMYHYFQGYIALYSVALYGYHRDGYNEQDTYYELLGILDMEKLPLALAEKVDSVVE